MGLKLLVYYVLIDDVRDAIQREKNIKHWPRAWKVRLIHGFNPESADLYQSESEARRGWREKPGHDSEFGAAGIHQLHQPALLHGRADKGRK